MPDTHYEPAGDGSYTAQRAAEDQHLARACMEAGDASLPAALNQPMRGTKSAGHGSRDELREVSAIRRRCLTVMRSLNDKEKLTEGEQRAFDLMAQAIDHQTKRIDFIQGSLDNAGAGGRKPNERSKWTDANGRPVTVLGRHESVAEAIAGHTGQHLGQMPSTSLARVVQGMVTGDQAEQITAGGMQASLLTGSDPDGGFFVNPTLAGSMIDHARAQSTAIEAGVRTMVMESPEVRIVRVEDDPEFAFTGEKQKFPESSPPFGMVRLVAKKLGVTIPVSRELIEDAVGLQQELDRLLGESIATSIDSAIYQGNGGKGSFTGILAAKHVQEHQAALPKVLSWDDLLESQFKLEQANLGTDTRLVMPPTLAKQLRSQKDGELRYIEPPADMRELPRMVSTNLPDQSAIYGRFSEGILGIRSQLSIQVNPYAAGDRDMVLIIARWRGDFAITRPQGLVKLTGFDGTTE